MTTVSRQLSRHDLPTCSALEDSSLSKRSLAIHSCNIFIRSCDSHVTSTISHTYQAFECTLVACAGIAQTHCHTRTSCDVDLGLAQCLVVNGRVIVISLLPTSSLEGMLPDKLDKGGKTENSELIIIATQ